MFGELMQMAQIRRFVSRRETNSRREIATRAKKSSDSVIDGKFVRVSDRPHAETQF
jgi:hypothetical protein